MRNLTGIYVISFVVTRHLPTGACVIIRPNRAYPLRWNCCRPDRVYHCVVSQQWEDEVINAEDLNWIILYLEIRGYGSSRVRQNLASVLTKDLRLDWRPVAEFFQLCWEEYCPANYGSWTYFAGISGDPNFRTVSQDRRGHAAPLGFLKSLGLADSASGNSSDLARSREIEEFGKYV
ncbi:hypothetical protein ACHAXA_003516 [Cyclostephanos tholiformis]|uniref:Cryptochrome/DNA photolyase FAD-binding domain-containing protein n=1 Tax=Cyclostephanos tholiformis TaxID=382380 RepID=A0ABD3SG11_9STRA